MAVLVSKDAGAESAATCLRDLCEAENETVLPIYALGSTGRGDYYSVVPTNTVSLGRLAYHLVLVVIDTCTVTLIEMMMMSV
jgi:hypothetical protein